VVAALAPPLAGGALPLAAAFGSSGVASTGSSPSIWMRVHSLRKPPSTDCFSICWPAPSAGGAPS